MFSVTQYHNITHHVIVLTQTYSGIIGPGGRIKGCFDEVFDGITV